MCGIAGFVGRGSADGLESMTRSLRHRGPDDTGTWTSQGPTGWVGLGSTRLAILDLTDAGHMPMTCGTGRFVIVYNGELYNSPELRDCLGRKGHRFHSTGDTEVVLAAYREYGPDCLQRFNGMYAVAIWDREEHALFLARDHFGIKPLYLVELPGGMAFASEVKALLRLPEVEARMDHEALTRYLTFLWVPEPDTLFEGIRKMEAGHYGLYRDGRWTLKRHWDLRYPPESDPYPAATENELADGLRERFQEAVKGQMLSDAPIGAFLSAGLDSNSIVASMRAASSGPVRTFTISFPPHARRGAYGFDDPDVARRAAERLGCTHRTLVVEPDVVGLLPKLVWHMDEPVADPAIITAYLVNQAAARDVKVLLSGVGGDELFAGYRKYAAHRLALSYQRIPRLLRSGLIEPLVARLPEAGAGGLGPRLRLLKKMARSGSLPPVERFLMDGTYLTEAEKAGLVTPATWGRTGRVEVHHRHLEAFERVHEADFLNQMLYVDKKTFMPSLNLLYNDKMSMASSVEVRVPFLDRELVEWVAASVPPDLKLKGTKTKFILRKAMGPLTGPEVLQQRKTGFGAPLDVWLREDLREMLDDLLSPDRVRRRGLFRESAVRDLIDRHRGGKGQHGFQLWQLLTLELWAERFLDEPKVSPRT